MCILHLQHISIWTSHISSVQKGSDDLPNSVDTEELVGTLPVWWWWVTFSFSIISYTTPSPSPNNNPITNNKVLRIMFLNTVTRHFLRTSQVALVVKNLPGNAGDIKGVGLIPGSGRSPLQYSCLENPTDRGAW